MSNIYVFYHSADLDGQSSAAIINLWYKNKRTIQLIPIDHGEPFPWELIHSDDTVYVVDYVLSPFKDMVQLNNICELIWIDHHKSAIENYNESIKNGAKGIKGLREIGRGACELVWNYMYPYDQLPESIYYLSLYDVWKHQEEPNSLYFQYGMKGIDNTNPSNEDLWEKLIFNNNRNLMTDIIKNGKVIIEYQRTQNKRLCEFVAFETDLDGFSAIAINNGPPGSSQRFESVWDNKKYDLMINFYRKDHQWVISLYTDKNEVDVSNIAKGYGGGGHMQAAGMSLDTLPFNY